MLPNQALYQAEPQPELIVNPAREHRARSYFACFAPRGKERSPATLTKSAVPAKSDQPDVSCGFELRRCRGCSGACVKH